MHRVILCSVFLSLLAGNAAAASSEEGSVPMERDRTYEQNLRWENGPDKTVTPAKVIRWMMSLRGQTVAAPSSTEFQPIVNAHDGHVRLVAAFAYKF